MHELFQRRSELKKEINALQAADKEAETVARMRHLEAEKKKISQQIEHHKKIGKKQGYTLSNTSQSRIQELRQELRNINQEIKRARRRIEKLSLADHRERKELEMEIEGLEKERKKILAKYREIPELREEERIASEALGYRNPRGSNRRKDTPYADRGPEWLRHWR